MPDVRRKVLVVDDEVTIRSLLREALGSIRPDLETIEADDAPPAIAILESVPSVPVDLVLCDLVMPGGDGREVLAATRKHRPATPFVAMTGYSPEPLTEPVEGFLAKPFNLTELVALMNELLPVPSQQVA